MAISAIWLRLELYHHCQHSTSYLRARPVLQRGLVSQSDGLVIYICLSFRPEVFDRTSLMNILVSIWHGVMPSGCRAYTPSKHNTLHVTRWICHWLSVSPSFVSVSLVFGYTEPATTKRISPGEPTDSARSGVRKRWSFGHNMSPSMDNRVVVFCYALVSDYSNRTFLTL